MPYYFIKHFVGRADSRRCIDDVLHLYRTNFCWLAFGFALILAREADWHTVFIKLSFDFTKGAFGHRGVPRGLYSTLSMALCQC